MWPVLLTCLLMPAQAEEETTTAAAAAAATSSASSGGERWPLMEALQGTWPGWLLDGNRLRVYGWTEGIYTASSATGQQLPMGFNFRANEPMLLQNWIRIERTVDQSAV